MVIKPKNLWKKILERYFSGVKTFWISIPEGLVRGEK